MPERGSVFVLEVVSGLSPKFFRHVIRGTKAQDKILKIQVLFTVVIAVAEVAAVAVAEVLQ